MAESENKTAEINEVTELGQTRQGSIHCLSIIGQIEGHQILPEDVKDFEECFVTNSLMGIMPVTALGEVEFQSRKVTESWMAKYEDFVYKAAYK